MPHFGFDKLSRRSVLYIKILIREYPFLALQHQSERVQIG